jgi:hypothetical protein
MSQTQTCIEANRLVLMNKRVGSLLGESTTPTDDCMREDISPNFIPSHPTLEIKPDKIENIMVSAVIPSEFSVGPEETEKITNLPIFHLTFSSYLSTFKLFPTSISISSSANDLGYNLI